MQLLGVNGPRRIYKTTIAHPAEEDHVIYCGFESIELPDGSKKDLPGDNRWWREDQARSWLAGIGS